MTSTILPPLPDRLMSPAKKDEVVGFLVGSEIPSRYARAWLGKWAALVGVTLTTADYERVSRRPLGSGPEQRVPVGEQFRRVFPGLKPAESVVWRKYLAEHETDYTSFEYNVRVGDGLRVPARAVELDPSQARVFEDMWRQLTQRKIDVLAFRSDEAWLIEVEDRADTATLGQVLMYEDLLAKQRPELGPVVKLVVCNRVGQDLLESFDRQGVVVWRADQA